MLKDWLMRCAVSMPVRYTKKQRAKFISAMQSYGNEKGYTTEIISQEGSKCAHLAFGNIDAAKVIVAAGYDTPLMYWFKPGYYPFYNEGNIHNTRIELTIRTLIGIMIILLGFGAWLGLRNTQFIVGIIIFALMVILGIFGIITPMKNKTNFERNSAAVSVLMEMVETNTNPDMAFVLMDQCVNSNVGIGVLAKRMKHHPLLIMLDGLANGSVMVVAENDKTIQSLVLPENMEARYHHYDETKQVQNRFMYYSPLMVICCGEIHDGQFMIPLANSSKDVLLNTQRLQHFPKWINALADQWIKGGF